MTRNVYVLISDYSVYASPFFKSKVDGSPQQRERSSSPQDMDISDSESEDGQISKQELEEERLLSLGGYKSSAKEEAVETPCTMTDLEICRLTRDLIVKHNIKPWFEDYVKGKDSLRSSLEFTRRVI